MMLKYYHRELFFKGWSGSIDEGAKGMGRLEEAHPKAAAFQASKDAAKDTFASMVL